MTGQQRAGDPLLRVTGSPDLFLKSRPTRDRFVRRLSSNLEMALERSGIEAAVSRIGAQELGVASADPDLSADCARRVFGVGRVSLCRPLPFDGMEGLALAAAAAAGHRVAGRRFAVRVRRRGSHQWSSTDLERLLGSMLLDDSAGVDLVDPEETIRLLVTGDEAMLVVRSWEGPGGLPLGSQSQALALFSGGIDSAVAAWMMMRAGCPTHLLHFEMDCSVTDQALLVGHELVRRWGAGPEVLLHVADFQAPRAVLTGTIPPRHRQVLLKRLMLQAAEAVARRLGVPMLVTGDSLGQVSSQTAAHLVELDRSVEIPVIRPLVALRKEEIVRRARRIGTFELSIRTKEMCDLSEGSRVATRASSGEITRAAELLPAGLVDEVVRSVRSLNALTWMPGMPPAPT